MRIYYHSKFIRQYKKLPDEIKILAKEKEIIFRSNPHDQRLRTHKLSGRLSGFYAFSVNYSYRVIFEFAADGVVEFYEIGDHDIYE